MGAELTNGSASANSTELKPSKATPFDEPAVEEPHDNNSLFVKKDSLFEHWLVENICEPVAMLVPASVHPNHITVFNTFINWLAVFIAFAAFTYDDADQPSAALFCRLFLSSLVCLSMILDCVDGIHARATGQTSNVGECLDHSLDAINIQLMSACSAITFRADPVTSAVTFLGSAAVFHAQLLVYRKRHVMINGPTSGPEAQTLVFLSHALGGTFIYALGIDTEACKYVLYFIYILANVVQLNTCRYYLVLLRRYQQVTSYLIFLATSSLYACLMFAGLLSISEFIFVYAMVPFRSTGLLVLYSVTEKYRPGAVDAGQTSFLGTVDPFLVCWFVVFAVIRSLFSTTFASSVLPLVFCVHLALNNARHFGYCYPMLLDEEPAKKAK